MFLEQLEALAPWGRLEQHIVPHYPKAGRGRRPYTLPVMLRVHVVRVTYNFRDPAMEDLLYEADSVRRFAGLRLSEDIPDESTIPNFRHLLERHRLGQELFEEIKGHLKERGVMLKQESIVDVTIITAPSSTRNKGNQRDPEMRRVKKGCQYHFGMKLHIGVVADSGLVHSMATAATNVHDVTQAHRLLHGRSGRYGEMPGTLGWTSARKEPGG